ncbi:MAG: DNA polymerase IV [Candidatus Doudnabacteria bacterium]|nr:DNA polymerase IV [Candidatus Doudnabacteria bacterium]
MNSYFASVEQQDNLLWRGKPLGVCEHLGGIIIAASIEAKRWGIKTGTPVWEAKKLYPKIILTHTRAEAYRHYHRLFLKVLRDYSSFVEPASIDEAYVDITASCNIKLQIPNYKFQKIIQITKSKNDQLKYFHKAKLDYYLSVNPFEEAVRVAWEIKQRIKREVGDYLTCGIGVADNKLLAKIASDMQKPDGLVIISNAELRIKNLECFCKNSVFCICHSKFLNFTKEDLYEKLKLTDIPGIARRQEKRLNELGIRTLKDLRDFPLSRLVRVFGISGYHLHHMGKLDGSWKSKVHHDQTIKSIGHMYTLPKEYRGRDFFEPVLYKLCEMVAERLRRKKLWGNVLVAYVRDGEYNSYGNSVTLGEPIFDARDLFCESRKILRNFLEAEKVIANCKLVGVTVDNLKPYVFQQALFKKHTSKGALMIAIDVINAKYGKFTVSYTPVLKAGKVFRDSVGFGRVKEV